MLRTSGMNLAELRDAVEDRDLWRKLTMTIARALRVDSTRLTRWVSRQLVYGYFAYDTSSTDISSAMTSLLK